MKRLRKVVRSIARVYWATRTALREEGLLAKAFETRGESDLIAQYIEEAIAAGIAKVARPGTIKSPPPDYRRHVRPASAVRSGDYAVGHDLTRSRRFS